VVAVLRYLTAGESHGRALMTILEGFPAGCPLVAEDIDAEMVRRQGGYGRGGRMAIERDRVTIMAGVRRGYTLGSPLGFLIRNRDWPNWEAVMAPEPGDPGDPIRRPRPGHADLAGAVKYGHHDLRNVLERASARETAARVAAGAAAAVLLAEMGVRIISWTHALGDVAMDPDRVPTGRTPEEAWEDWRTREAATDLRCPDPGAEEQMIAAIDAAREAGDTLGGVIGAVALGVPPGLGSHVQSDRRLDGRLAGAVTAIQGIKGVEIGEAVANARRLGSLVHDPIHPGPVGRTFPVRPTNRAGGLEGGMTNGEPVVVHAHMKPISTLRRSMESIDLDTREAVLAHHERSDVCAVPAAGVVVEAAMALCLADAFLEKFGGDSLCEIRRALQHYREGL